MIHDIKHPAWADLIKGKSDPEISSFSLKMKLNSLRDFYNNGFKKIDEAVNELHDFCNKYEKIYSSDLQKIFENKNTSI